MKFLALVLLCLLPCVVVSQRCDAALGQETVDPSETQAQTVVVQAGLFTQNGQYPRVVLRDQHPKAQGCVYGKLTVNTGLPAALKNGIFAQEGKEYDVWIRFSNGDQPEADDATSNARGLALKVLGVTGERLNEGGSSQDFLLIGSASSSFFASNVSDYVALITQGSAAFFAARPRNFEAFRAAAVATRASLLQGPYDSMLPVRIGSAAVKLQLTRCEGTNFVAANATLDPRNYLRTGLAQQLDPRQNYDAGCFVFSARQQADPCSTPIEDASVPWTTPMTPLARLTIPKQKFDTPSTAAFCENLSFTPWNGLKAHQPLGSNSRARKIVYDTSSSTRHTFNNEPLIEPRTTPLSPTSAPTTAAPSTSAPASGSASGSVININFGGLFGR